MPPGRDNPCPCGGFINDAVRARLRPSREALDEAYKTAACERWRQSEAREWEPTDTEWPE